MAATVLTGSQIDRFRAKVLLSALKLEILGMKRNGKSAYSIIKTEFGLKGNKRTVCNQLEALLSYTE
jgi:hypothetical protein